jgi:predicted regulator of Ras-like GTPase activity (Roadblock/LC7/MglB family)
MPPSGLNRSFSENALPFQEAARREMQGMVQIGGFAAIYLFSQEGLLLASQVASTGLLQEDHAVEFAVLMAKLKKVVKKMSGLGPLKELVIEDGENRRIVFRYLTLFGQTALLLLVVPSQRSYRGLANRLCRLIEAQAAQ